MSHNLTENIYVLNVHRPMTHVTLQQTSQEIGMDGTELYFAILVCIIIINKEVYKVFHCTISVQKLCAKV